MSPTPRPPCARSGDVSLWKNKSKMRGNRVRGDPDAVVAHTDLERPVALAGVDRDLAAGLGELGGVVQDVGHDLDETDPIAVDQERAVGIAETVW